MRKAATAANTGQNVEAAALYGRVVVDGQLTGTNPIRPQAGFSGVEENANLSLEATRRLAVMAAQKASVDAQALRASDSIPVAE